MIIHIIIVVISIIIVVINISIIIISSSSSSISQPAAMLPVFTCMFSIYVGVIRSGLYWWENP